MTGGLPAADIRASLKSLAEVRLLEARKSRMRFAKSITEFAESDVPAASEMLDGITNRRRVIRVPRRLVRELATGMSKAVMATVYAHLIRCVYFQAAKRRYRIDGRCKASWIADTFCVSERAVVTARRKLIDQGWLILLESPQWQLNRYGLRLAVDLAWSAAAQSVAQGERPMAGMGDVAKRRCGNVATSPTSAPAPVTKRSSSHQAKTAGRTSDPTSNSTLLRKNTTPAPQARNGVRKRTKREGKHWLGRLEVRDLVEPERLEQVRQKLVRKGLLNESESDRHRLLCAAAHAMSKANTNPCGLFYVMFRDGLWHHVTERDEQAVARRRWPQDRATSSEGRCMNRSHPRTHDASASLERASSVLADAPWHSATCLALLAVLHQQRAPCSPPAASSAMSPEVSRGCPPVAGVESAG